MFFFMDSFPLLDLIARINAKGFQELGEKALPRLDGARYLQLMREIKRRTETVTHFTRNPASALYLQTAVESTCLQLRMILALVALGSLWQTKTIGLSR